MSKELSSGDQTGEGLYEWTERIGEKSKFVRIRRLVGGAIETDIA